MREAYRKCRSCGKVFLSKHPQQVRCPDCQRVHVKELQRKYQKEKEKIQPTPDPNECSRKKSCKYGSRSGGLWLCDYLAITGEMRGCPVQGCTKYKRRPRGKKQEVENG